MGAVQFFGQVAQGSERQHPVVLHGARGVDHHDVHLRLYIAMLEPVVHDDEVDVGVLGAKQLNLGLHERKRRAQFVRRIARKLSLCGKSLVKAGNHVVKRRAAAPEFRGHVLADFCVGEVVGPHALDLRRKEAQRPQRMSAHKVGQHAAEQRHRRSYIPARRAKRFLGVVHDDGQRVVELFVCRVK